MTQRPLLDVKNLQVGFPGFPIVRDVSFSIQPGETMALVGESGCGKSLTAFSILRLLPRGAAITGGSISLDGRDLAQVSEAAMRDIRGKQISLILQEPMTALDPVLTIGAQVREVLLRHEPMSRQAATRRVFELLELVGIREPQRRYYEYPHNYSGGMRQRVMIAIAIACNPRLIIADEPTTALDVTIQSQVMELLDRLRKQLSVAMLLITHDLTAVRQWADRVAVMYAGRVAEQAPVATFFDGPTHPYSLGLLASSIGDGPDWHYSKRRLTEIKGSVASAAGEPGCAFFPRCPVRIPLCRTTPPPLHPVTQDWNSACVHVDAADKVS